MYESIRGRFRDQAAIEINELPKMEDRTLMEVMHAEAERRRGVGSAKTQKVRRFAWQIRVALKGFFCTLKTRA
jgi:hypothetical protein